MSSRKLREYAANGSLNNINLPPLLLTLTYWRGYLNGLFRVASTDTINLQSTEWNCCNSRRHSESKCYLPKSSFLWVVSLSKWLILRFMSDCYVPQLVKLLQKKKSPPILAKVLASVFANLSTSCSLRWPSSSSPEHTPIPYDYSHTSPNCWKELVGELFDWTICFLGDNSLVSHVTGV